MKPEHLDWLETIWGKLSQVANKVLALDVTREFKTAAL
jgi:hypothetical protein